MRKKLRKLKKTSKCVISKIVGFLFEHYSLIILVEVPSIGLMSNFKYGDQAKKFILTQLAKKLRSRGVYSLSKFILKHE